ncbi:cold shock domain-containing protein [Rhizobium sp. SYY.PMSO]|uniref:cold shock domain-containing protein n=1 Tax=Rhizobium sp. SYY.PMSO TaxID=3382192 RepID=UPI0039900202
MARGKVKWFDANKKYGFLEPDDGGPDVFVHLSEVMKAKLPHLTPGAPIAYTLEIDDGKRSARDLSPVAANADPKPPKERKNEQPYAVRRAQALR